VRDLTEQDMKIAKNVAEYLKQNNIRLAGIDVIGNHLTEINITSPGSLKLLGRQHDVKPTDILVDGIIKDIDNKRYEKMINLV
jgi:glutathione synthase